MDCQASAPITARVAASGKGKEKKKEAHTISAAAGTEGEEQLVVASSSTRIVELSTDDEMMDF